MHFDITYLCYHLSRDINYTERSQSEYKSVSLLLNPNKINQNYQKCIPVIFGEMTELRLNVTNGISHLSAIQTTPIVFGILTTQTEELAYERASPDKMNKGREFGETAQFMMKAFESL